MTTPTTRGPRPPAPIADALLLRFRRAVEIEPRILHIEDWLERDRPEPHSPAHGRRWTVATLRLLRLVARSPRLSEADHDAAHRYLLAVHELEGGA